ncbi:rod shape-determining protein MreC, partial [bacterium]|nr:rod shape-determining protein MreC [bacterium]
RGTEDGVLEGMPVIVPEGLVGKIARVYRGKSLIEPLTSASSAVAVTIERSRVRGIVRPRYRSSSELLSWEMDYVPARSDIRTGDQIITSGLGGVYPAGLVVGHISSVTEEPLTMQVGVDLSVEFSTTEQVFVVTGRAIPIPGRGDKLVELARSLLREESGSSEEDTLSVDVEENNR